MLRLKSIKNLQKQYPGYGSSLEFKTQYRRIFINACDKNELEILEAISQIEKASFIIDLIRFKNYEAFNKAVRNGHLPIVNKLIELTNGIIDQKQMIHPDNDYAFRDAAENGHLNILNRLVELTPEPEQLEQMIHASNDYAFIYAAAKGYINIVRKLIKFTPKKEQLDQMIHAGDDYAFHNACKNGHFKVINLLIEIIGNIKALNKMIQHYNAAAFRYAIEYNDLTSVNKMIELTSTDEKQWEQMINRHFLKATVKGHLNIVIRLIELTPNSKRLSMISSDNMRGPCYVAYNEYLELSQYYLSFFPELKDTMVQVGPNEEFKQKIQDSDRFVQKLITLRKENGEYSVMKFFDYLKYGKSIKDFALTGKAFIKELENLGLLEVLADYLGAQDVTLSRAEKVKVIKTLAAYRLSNDNSSGVGSNGITSLIVEKNPQDKKVSFVERIIAEKASFKAHPSLSVS